MGEGVQSELVGEDAENRVSDALCASTGPCHCRAGGVPVAPTAWLGIAPPGGLPEGHRVTGGGKSPAIRLLG